MGTRLTLGVWETQSGELPAVPTIQPSALFPLELGSLVEPSPTLAWVLSSNASAVESEKAWPSSPGLRPARMSSRTDPVGCPAGEEQEAGAHTCPFS